MGRKTRRSNDDDRRAIREAPPTGKSVELFAADKPGVIDAPPAFRPTGETVTVASPFYWFSEGRGGSWYFAVRRRDGSIGAAVEERGGVLCDVMQHCSFREFGGAEIVASAREAV